MKFKFSKINIRYVFRSLIVLLLMLTFDSLQKLAIILTFFLINFLMAAVKRYVIPPGIKKYLYGVELIMFSTVLTSISFGPRIGSISGALLIIINYFGENRISRFTFVPIALYSLIGYLAYFMKFLDIMILGLILTIGYNILSSLIVINFMGANKTTMIIFNIVNIVFNLIVFRVFGNFFMHFIA